MDLSICLISMALMACGVLLLGLSMRCSDIEMYTQAHDKILSELVRDNIKLGKQVLEITELLGHMTGNKKHTD